MAHILIAITAAMCAALNVSKALAEPRPAEVMLAEALFREARALIDAGATGEACRKFGESQRLDPATGTLLNLAVCHERDSKYALAWVEFMEVRDTAVREGNMERANFAAERLSAIEKIIPKLRIVVPPASRVPGLEVVCDETTISSAAWGSQLPLDPGKHKLIATAPGRRRWDVTVTLALGQHGRLTLPALTPLPVSTARVTAVVVGSAGLTALVVGAVAGGLALAKNSESNEQCVNDQCNGAGKAARDDARLAGDVSTALLTAGAGHMVGAVMLWLLPSVDRDARMGRSRGSGGPLGIRHHAVAVW